MSEISDLDLWLVHHTLVRQPIAVCGVLTWQRVSAAVASKVTEYGRVFGKGQLTH